jgi:plastocyanin domain-containing protein
LGKEFIENDRTFDVTLQKGEYNYSCSMGMFRGKIVAIDRPTDEPAKEPTAAEPTAESEAK